MRNFAPDLGIVEKLAKLYGGLATLKIGMRTVSDLVHIGEPVGIQPSVGMMDR